MSERSKERDSRAANDFKTVWLRKAVLAHERVRSFACAMHSWVRTPLQPTFFRDVKYSYACYASVCTHQWDVNRGCALWAHVTEEINVAHVTTANDCQMPAADYLNNFYEDNSLRTCSSGVSI